MKSTPKYIMRKAFSAIRQNKRSTWFPEYFLVNDKSLQKWLENQAVITSDSGETQFNGFKSRFCWVSQNFIISP